MNQISAGYGEPRFTLYIPLSMHRLTRPLDLALLAEELTNKVSVQVTVSEGRGWEQLQIGPFDTESLACEMFHRINRLLATLNL